MMNFRLIIFITSVAFLFSCQREIRAKFEITNNTENTIDSINIKSFDHEVNINYLKLETGHSQTYWLDMTNLPKVDGDYLLAYKDSIMNIYRFGYFTNGFPLERVTKVSIEKDTVIIDQIINDY